MKKVLITIWLTFGVGMAAYGQTTMTIPTYNVSPFGKYYQMRLMPHSSPLGTLGAPCSSPGTLYVYQNSTNHATIPYICDNTSAWSLVSGVWTENGSSDIYPTSNTGNEKVGIGLGTDATGNPLLPTFKLTLAQGGILALGQYGSGTGLTTNLPAGAYFIWYPKKAALRAGEFSAGLADADIGDESVALGGNNNTAAAMGSSVLGGTGNVIGAAGDATSPTYSVIGGGNTNTITVNAINGAQTATILGGTENCIGTLSNGVCTTPNYGTPSDSYGTLAFIGGGSNNTAGGGAAILGAGDGWAGGESAAVLGGASNTASGMSSFVGGGQNNNSSGEGATIIGGSGNIVNGENTFPIPANSLDGGIIGGGESNTLSYAHVSVIGGGMKNTIAAGSTINSYPGPSRSSMIGGGEGNCMGKFDNSTGACTNDNDNATYIYDTIGGGQGNNIYQATFSAITGGSQNNILGWINYAPYYVEPGNMIIAGGSGNSASTWGDSIVAGQNNSIDGGQFINAVIGGKNNEIRGANNQNSFIGGGSGNTLHGSMNTILGGESIQAPRNGSDQPNQVLLMGQNFTTSATSANTFVWGQFDSSSPPTIDATNAFIISGSGTGTGGATGPVKVGIGTQSPQYALDVGGTTEIDGNGNTVTISPAFTDHSGTFLHLDTSSASQGLVGQDIAEMFPASQEIRAGELVIVDEDGTGRPALKPGSHPYDRRVVGVASASPGLVFQGGEITAMPEKAFKQGTEVPVAVAGRVKLNVCLENGPIEAGDLLTSSSVPGYAMKASDPSKAFDAVVAKALEPFNGDNGKHTKGSIEVLVTLR